MSSPEVPADSVSPLNFMRGLRSHSDRATAAETPFLNEAERTRLDDIVFAWVEYGPSDRLRRQTHDLLVQLAERDKTDQFLTENEQTELAQLIELDPLELTLPIAEEPGQRSMTTGEYVAAMAIVLSVTAVTVGALLDSATAHSALMVGILGVICGGGSIAITRYRSAKRGPVATTEGLLFALIWMLAGAIMILLWNRHTLSVGQAAFSCFLGAGLLGQATLRIGDQTDSA
jgi:hypothetical protein